MMREFFQQADLAVTAFGVVFALCNCFLGYRLRKLWFALLGFAIGGSLGFSIPVWMGLDAGISTLIGVAAGVVFALLSFKLYLCGVFLLCGGLFFLLWSLLLPTGLSVMVHGMLLLGGVALSILIGIISVKAVRPVVMLTTAFSGGYAAVSGLFLLFHAQSTAMTIVLGIILGVAGLIFQFVDDKRRNQAGEVSGAAKAPTAQQRYGYAPETSFAQQPAATPREPAAPATDNTPAAAETPHASTDAAPSDES